MFPTCALTVDSLMTSWPAISALRAPRAASSSRGCPTRWRSLGGTGHPTAHRSSPWRLGRELPSFAWSGLETTPLTPSWTTVPSGFAETDRVGDARAPAGAHRLLEAMAVAEILGREAEVQAVGRFLDGPAPAALILEGPAGIGKTTVRQAGLEHAHTRGRRVLVTRPSEVETAPATAGLIDLLGDVFDEHGGSSAGASAGGARRGAASRGRSARRCAARNGLRRRARTAPPRIGGVARSACGRRPAVAGRGHGRDADVRTAPTDGDARAAPRDHAHRRAASRRATPSRSRGIG